MSDQWTAVDAYLAATLIGGDPALDAALAANRTGGLPAIDVSPVQGKLLHLLARLIGARHILEVGTLGGYSTICLARALPADGRIVSLEIDPHHADVARANCDRAGVGDRVEIRVGPASNSLAALAAEAGTPFDMAFIDADKPGNPAYVQAALGLSRPGGLIVVDNVVRAGRILDAGSKDEAVIGTRRLFDMIAAEPRLDATAIQTVGSKGWDGLAIMRVASAD
jgi:predicted O-methyltransferase YrrM